MKDDVPLRFRCHTGHAYTLESLLSEMDEEIENSLWNAIRALEERVMLLKQAAEHVREAHQTDAGELLSQADETQQRADLVRKAVLEVEEEPQATGSSSATTL
jgi:two-component system chemotaxis response regulator CheB